MNSLFIVLIVILQDVLCGRGGQSNNHPGNEWYEKKKKDNLVTNHFVDKQKGKKNQKRFSTIAHEFLFVSFCRNSDSSILFQMTNFDDDDDDDDILLFSNSVRFRRLVRSNRALYRSCPKHTKLLVAKAIVQAVQQQDPPGRFIKMQDPDSDAEQHLWEPITYAQAVNKTSQALREKDAASRNQAKKEAQQQKLVSQESTPKTVEKDAKRVKFGGVEALESDSNPANTAAKQTEKPQKRKSDSDSEGESTSKRGGKKRKIADTFVKPFWWGRAPAITRVTNGRTTVYNPSRGVVTPGMDTSLNSEDSNHQNNQVNTMGRGVVNQVDLGQTEQEPMPLEAPLVSRQSSMFRFLSNTGIFNRGTSGVVAPTQAEENSHPATDALNNLNASEKSFDGVENTYSSNMGKTSVQELRSRAQQKRHSLLSVTDSSMDDFPTVGLINDDEEVLPPPTPRGLKTQMSDWFTSIFPSPSKTSLANAAPPNTKNDAKPAAAQQQQQVDEASIPPPPGAGMGRSVSSALFGSLIESPSLFLTTLKSGVSSMFGDSVVGQDAGPIRRFPSSFQRQEQQQEEQTQTTTTAPPSSYSGTTNSITTNTTGMIPAVLGEKATRGDSLLDDFEETPMEKSLRNVNASSNSTGLYF